MLQDWPLLEDIVLYAKLAAMLHVSHRLKAAARSFLKSSQGYGICASLAALQPTLLVIPQRAFSTTGPMASNKMKVLFCGKEFPPACQFTSEYLQHDKDIEVAECERSDLLDTVDGFHVLVPKMSLLSAEVLQRARSLKLIVQFGVGLEGVDIPAASARGVKVARIDSRVCGNAASTAEHAVYLTLALLRDQHGMAGAVQRRQLGTPIGQSLSGKKVMIVGFGNIGREIAVRLRGWGVHLTGIRRSWGRGTPTDGENGEAHAPVEPLLDRAAGIEGIKELLPETDVVILSLLLNSDTRGMVNNEFVRSMKKGALLVNIARGGLLDYEAVKAGLESGQIGGLGVDVAWHEPFDPTDPIARHPRCILTPHIAGVTENSYRDMAKIVGDTVRQLRDGKPLDIVDVVN